LQQAQALGLPGIPRDELLAHLRSAAEALHALFGRHKLLHLTLNPRNLLLDGERLLLADFGLAELLWRSARQAVAQLNGRYSAPELFAGTLSPAADQYSLALIYHELLTGRLPADPSGLLLEQLPPGDRPIVARALHPQPRQRWATAVEFIAALEAVAGPAPAPLPAFTRPRPGADPAAGVLQTRFGTSLSAEVVRQRLECQGKDISLNGIGFYLPGQLPGSQLLLHLPQTPQTPALTVPARVVRSGPCGDGWLEVGAVLLHAQKDGGLPSAEV
jgi:serine/threonine protein kinase